MTNLDINTPKGQQTLVDVAAAAAIWEACHEGCKYAKTPEHLPSSIDAILLRGDVIEGVAETKCRYSFTLDEFRTAYKCEWLVTMDKLVKASQVAAMLRVPAYGFLYIAKDRVLLTQQITDNEGQFCVPLRCDRTATQRTINGGEAIRANAYIDMTGAREWRLAEGTPAEQHGCLGSSTRLET